MIRRLIAIVLIATVAFGFANSANAACNPKFTWEYPDSGREIDELNARFGHVLERNNVCGKISEVMIGGLRRYTTSSDIKVGVVFNGGSRKEELLHLPVDCNSGCIWNGVVDWFDKLR